MRVAAFFFLLVFLAAPEMSFSVESGEGLHAEGDSIMVSGVGYPPIKAENAAQARLMARRAAVLDAYRNALGRPGTAGGDEKIFYSGLSGFVKGLVIDREEYLEDGGIRIFGRIPRRNIAPVPAARSGPGPDGGKPSAVPLNEWYKIIERSVKFR